MRVSACWILPWMGSCALLGVGIKNCSKIIKDKFKNHIVLESRTTARSFYSYKIKNWDPRHMAKGSSLSGDLDEAEVTNSREDTDTKKWIEVNIAMGNRFCLQCGWRTWRQHATANGNQKMWSTSHHRYFSLLLPAGSMMAGIHWVPLQVLINLAEALVDGDF